MSRHHLATVALGSLLGLLFLLPEPVDAWTIPTRIEMADYALRVAPPHLVGQVERHQKKYHAGIKAAAKHDPRAKSSAAAVDIDSIVQIEVDRAVQSIVEHEPFSEIVFRLGVVAYWVASANDPLASIHPPYSQDYSRYLQDASRRFAVLYYGHDRRFESTAELEALIERSLDRGLMMAPQVADEYRRIGEIDGLKLFDDRSTAFGIGSVAFSHGVSDIAGVLRYIWLAAGGADTLQLPPLDQDHLILVGRGERTD